MDETQIRHWLAEHLAELLGVNEAQIDIDADFDSFGLDSAAAVAMTGELEEVLGCDIDPSVAYDHRTIRQLSSHLAGLSPSLR
jgi:acyl carrier protein